MKWVPVAATLLLAAIGSAVAQPPPGYPQVPPPGPPIGFRSGQPSPPPPTYAPIPPPRPEVVPPPPRERMVWEPGHWHWNGYRYIWIGGRYIPVQAHHREYIPGAWAWRSKSVV